LHLLPSVEPLPPSAEARTSPPLHGHSKASLVHRPIRAIAERRSAVVRSSRSDDVSAALECDRPHVIARRLPMNQLGATAMLAVFAVGLLSACGGGNGSAVATLTNSVTRTTPTRSTPTVTTPTRPTPTVTESQTTTVVAAAPTPPTTTISGSTTTSGVSPAAAAAAAAAAASQNDESSSTQWGWIAFAILAAAVLVGGIVWWWRRHSARGKTRAPEPSDAQPLTDA
jgi:cobalamin biosynthesis Mg chelatase CobN